MSVGSYTLALEALKTIVNAYSGYEKGKFMKSDEAIRSEIQRRCEMITRHAEKIQEEVHNDGHRVARTMLEDLIESLGLFRSEAQFSISSNSVSQHSAIGKLKNKAIRKLVTHDHEVLQGLVEATRMANELVDQRPSLDEEQVEIEISNWHQKVTRVRNMYLERNMFIDGLTKR
ncbi:MAG: hypothetical protein ACPHEN_07655 [Candidatus Poseidoniaceae archaeon]|jgi:hypothetical protein